MAHTFYSSEQLFELGRENYEKLVSYCKKLEQGGFWQQAWEVMKQSSMQVLDLYVQSVLLCLAVHCGQIAQNQREYLLSVTDTNALDIPAQGEMGEELVRYAQKTEKMPPILIQLCGVYDRQEKGTMAAGFMDAMLNVMLCMAYLNEENEALVSQFLQEYYNKISMFVQVPGQQDRLSSHYIFRKMSSDVIRSDVEWLLHHEKDEEYLALRRKKRAGVKADDGSREESQSATGKADREQSCPEMEQNCPETGQTSLEEQKHLETWNCPEGQISLEEEQKALEAQKRLEEQRLLEKEQKRLEEEQARIAEQKRLAEEEQARLEQEERQAREEFQKVKKRLLEREKAEKEAQEKRIAELLKELNELVGLDSVKEEIQSLINLIKIRKLREKMHMPQMDMSYHMVFTGSPGTGKTTVARLVARIYKELGILSDGKLVETDRSRMVAGYVGQTAINVREIVEQAIGGVLFIDEAYALVSPDTANDFGSEAVDTLVKMMEDHRDNLVVIVAGYTEEMKVFLRSNTGLISRFNKFISFDDYSGEQLLEILQVMAKRAGLVIEEGAVKKVGERLLAMSEEEWVDFGNARGIRNVFEKMVMNQANRLVLLEEPTREQLMTITQEDAYL